MLICSQILGFGRGRMAFFIFEEVKKKRTKTYGVSQCVLLD